MLIHFKLYDWLRKPIQLIVTAKSGLVLLDRRSAEVPLFADHVEELEL
jgi:hypothetical protein